MASVRTVVTEQLCLPARRVGNIAFIDQLQEVSDKHEDCPGQTHPHFDVIPCGHHGGRGASFVHTETAAET